MTLRRYFKPVDQTADGLLPGPCGPLSARIPAVTIAAAFLSLELLGSNTHKCFPNCSFPDIFDIRGYRDLSGTAKQFPPFSRVKILANKFFAAFKI